MELLEPNIQSFVIKLWAEEIGDDKKWIRWRGYITHVGGGQRRYVQDLNEIITFIKPYMAVKSTP